MNKPNRLRIKRAKLTKTATALKNGQTNGHSNGHQRGNGLLHLNQPNQQATEDPTPGYSVIKVAVSFLTADPDYTLYGRTKSIVYSLEDNPPYSTLADDLPPIITANDNFGDAMAAASDGGKTVNSAKRAARASLVSLMRPLAARVQLLCQNNMTILLSSGFPVQKPNRTPAQIPATPLTPLVLQALTGQAYATTSPVDGAYIYNWRVASADAPDVVILHAQSTGGRTTLSGLTPGKTYLFQVNAVGTAGTSDWSNAASMIVV